MNDRTTKIELDPQEASAEGKPTSSDWGGLAWTPWVPFVGGDFRTLPASAGLYRVRVIGQDCLVYVGQTGRSLRERLRALRKHTLMQEMPFNDPHTAAPSLWAWAHAERFTFECSAACSTAERSARLALESWLLWDHRVSTGESTLCNHGGFHAGYKKSRNRSTGQRGGPIGGAPPEFRRISISSAPLLASGEFTGARWMGLHWTPWTSLKSVVQVSGKALYRLRQAGGAELLYIGETLRLNDRMAAHARTYGGLEVEFSCAILPPDTSKSALHELENDLLGCYFATFKRAPAHQFSNGRLGRTSAA